MKPLEPILTVDLFPAERAHLLGLLAGLSEDDWHTPTVCTGWSVKDVALHILGGDVGLLGRTPDFRFPQSGGFENWEALLAFINHANAIWVEATRRISPALPVKMLTLTGEEVYRFLQTIDLYDTGEAVDWAGPEPGPVWFDVAREYTERWLHQQPIRDAVGQSGLLNATFADPALAAFVRALPHTYRDVSAAEGTSLNLVISGEAGGAWALVREGERWTLYTGRAATPTAEVTMEADTAWRLFTKGLPRAELLKRITLAGDAALGQQVFEAVSIIA